MWCRWHASDAATSAADDDARAAGKLVERSAGPSGAAAAGDVYVECRWHGSADVDAEDACTAGHAGGVRAAGRVLRQRRQLPLMQQGSWRGCTTQGCPAAATSLKLIDAMSAILLCILVCAALICSEEHLYI